MGLVIGSSWVLINNNYYAPINVKPASGGGGGGAGPGGGFFFYFLARG